MEVITLIQGDSDSCLTPLFLVHAISGVALPYLRLEPLSDYDDRPVYGITSPVHCPGGDDFRFPSSLAELAAFYLDGIKRIQPQGPYLLGGWSMGGMIAMFMAQILQVHEEEVSKVIMIDSANPEVFPCFTTSQEHREFSRATFEKTIAFGTVQLGTCSASNSPIASPAASEIDDDDYLHARDRRASTWRTTSLESSPGSGASSIYDQSSPVFTPTSPLSPISSSDESDCSSDDECDSDLEDENEPPQLKDFLRRIKLHIHRGLQLIARIQPGDLLTPGEKSDYDVVLIKCRPEPADAVKRHHPSHEGAEFILSVMREKSMRWNAAQFRSFRTIPFSGDHDGAFQPQYVGELSSILRECLEDED